MQSRFLAVLVQRVIFPRGRIWHSTYAELLEVSASPFLQPVQVPLDGSTALWYLSHSLWCSTLCRLGESTLIMKRLNRTDSRTDPWGISVFWTPDGFCAANRNPLCPGLHPPFRASHHSFILSLFHRLSEEVE